MTVETKYGFYLEVEPGTVFASALAKQLCWEPEESELILSLLRAEDVAVDAGSHVGYFSCLMAQAGARVLAFEPNPTLRELAIRNCAGREITVYAEALSEMDGEAAFFLPSSWNDGWGSLAAADEGAASLSITVPTCRLAEKLPPGKIRLIKLDVEGAETLALRGTGDRLPDVDYLLVECVDIAPRVAALGSSVAGIGELLLADFQPFEFTNAEWRAADEVRSCFEHSFLFVNRRRSCLKWSLNKAVR